jgi:hypothetical protein
MLTGPDAIEITESRYASSEQASSLRWSLLSSPSDWCEPHIQHFWQHRLAQSDPISAVYRSPAWLNHLYANDDAIPLHLAVLRDGSGGVYGVAPLGIREVPLEHRAVIRALAGNKIRVVDILGGQPLIADMPTVYDSLLASLADSFPSCDGIQLADIPCEGPLLRHIRESAVVRRRFLVCVHSHLAPYQTLPLPASHSEYLAQFPQKKQYNLRRQARLLRELGKGKLELRRWESAGDVPELLNRLRVLAGRAKADGWGETAGKRYADLAVRELLRCYTLECGNEPVAALVGFQYGATYSVDRTLYDPALARLSPGGTMVHLAIADLLKHRPVRLIDYGYGRLSHDQQPRRTSRNYTKVLLLRRSWPNRLRWAGFCALRTPLQLLNGQLRRLLRRGSPTP